MHLTLPNGRVPAGSVALPGIHSVAAVAAARAALTSHQPSQNGGSRGFTLTSNRMNHPLSNVQQQDSPNQPPSPTMMGHQQQHQEQQHVPFYGLPSSFQKNKERPSNLGVPLPSSSAPQEQQQQQQPPPKQGKSNSGRHWLSCYHASSSTSSSQSPTPPPSSKPDEQGSETPSPTDHGFRPINSSGFERPTTLPVSAVLGAFQLNGEFESVALLETRTSLLLCLLLKVSSRPKTLL
jgi:hypothetical protein